MTQEKLTMRETCEALGVSRAMIQKLEATGELAGKRERHLEHMLREHCFRYFNAARPHQGIGERVPTAQALKARTDLASVIAVPVLGGLHHEYRAAA